MTWLSRQCPLPVVVACGLLASTALATLGAASAAHAAAPVYRCGNTYQQMPCADGRPLDVADVRDTEQRRQAERAAAAEQRSATALAAENRARDKSIQPQRRAVGVAPAADKAASADTPVAPHSSKSTPRKHAARHATDKTLYSAVSGQQAKKKKDDPAKARMPAP